MRGVVNGETVRRNPTMFTIGVFGIITDERDRVLLCHRRDFDLWNLPGGRVEAGESPWSALVREVEEETKQIERIKDFFADKAKTYCKVQTEGA